MDLGFRGEIADLYHSYRRGYPPAVLGAVVGGFGLGSDDVVVDLGCGTGQLTLPMAARVRAVVGVDPEADMLNRARRAAAEQGVANVSWLIGADADLPALRALLGPRTVGAVTIGQALHWMDFRPARCLSGCGRVARGSICVLRFSVCYSCCGRGLPATRRLGGIAGGSVDDRDGVAFSRRE